MSEGVTETVPASEDMIKSAPVNGGETAPVSEVMIRSAPVNGGESAPVSGEGIALVKGGETVRGNVEEIVLVNGKGIVPASGGEITLVNGEEIVPASGGETEVVTKTGMGITAHQEDTAMETDDQKIVTAVASEIEVTQGSGDAVMSARNLENQCKQAKEKK